MILNAKATIDAENGALLQSLQVETKDKNSLVLLKGDLSSTLVKINNSNAAISVAENAVVKKIEKDKSVTDEIVVDNKGRVEDSDGVEVPNNTTVPPVSSGGGSGSSGDQTTPVAGATGTITAASVTQTSLNLNWTKATDNVTSQSDLRYYVYSSTSNNIGSVANAEANGTLINSGGTLNINTLNVTGLTAGTTYYFNVVVRDSAGNKVAYTTVTQATSDQIAVTKTALTTKVNEAKAVTNVAVSVDGSDVLKTDKWTTQVELNAFNQAIAAAEAVLGNTTATQSAVDQAVTDLQTAMGDYAAAQKAGTSVDVVVYDTLPEQLLNAYDNANLPIRHKTAAGLGLISSFDVETNTIKLSGRTTVAQLESTNTGTPGDDGYVLYAINSPEGVSDVAKIELPSGNTYNLANFTTDGDDRLTNGYLLNELIYDADAQEGEKFVKNTVTVKWLDATDEVVATSTYTIDASAVILAVDGVDTSALTTKVNEAKAVTNVAVSEEGSDVLTTAKWTTQAELDAFTGAITVAEAVVADTNATQGEVDQAVAELNTAIQTYNNAVKNGLLSDVELYTDLPQALLEAYDESPYPISHKTATGLGLNSVVNNDTNTITLTGITTLEKLDTTDVATSNGYLQYAVNTPDEA
ncbi:fibronectin type III domain-containing protein [Metabacillus endolithicus]|uniref:fibronectin type III domain-containing protein n=1 Tax=Metabacillus endolithicus TaxID=1535204 RepID=UPI001FFBD628|nr:fibronectin type III domain-containing protein [Metabacillus endolithicus]UPG65417.1 fibronectin type III domain-containing protein [Metabacillus endolithicus]